MLGAVSKIEGDGGPDDWDDVDGRYDSCGDIGLEMVSGELFVLKVTRAVARRLGVGGDLPTWAVEDHSDEIVAASS